MADKIFITELPVKTSLSGSNVIPVDDGINTNKVTVDKLAEYVNSKYKLQSYLGFSSINFDESLINAENFNESIRAVIEAVPNHSIFIWHGTMSDNFAICTTKKIGEDCGDIYTSGTSIMVDIVISKWYSTATPCEIDVFIDSEKGRGRIYTTICTISSDNIIVSKFAETYHTDGFLPLDGTTVLPVAQGGTGANTAETALANLGGASASTHYIKTYNQATQLDLEDTEFSATDFQANAKIIMDKLQAIDGKAIYTIYYGNSTNISKSVLAKIQTDTGVVYSPTGSIVFNFKMWRTENLQSEIEVLMVGVQKRFTCLYYKGTVSAFAETYDENGFVPTARTINGKALSDDITLSASDVSAAASNTHKIKTYTSYEDIGLTSTGFSATDFNANITQIHTALGSGASILAMRLTSTENLTKSIKAKILADVNRTHSTYCTLVVYKWHNSFTPYEVHVMFNTKSTNVYKYMCTYQKEQDGDGPYISPFVVVYHESWNEAAAAVAAGVSNV